MEYNRTNLTHHKSTTFEPSNESKKRLHDIMVNRVNNRKEVSYEAMIGGYALVCLITIGLMVKLAKILEVTLW